jgi:cytochrome c-type biogenesis protein CcmI
LVIWIAAILLISAVALFVAAPLSDYEPGETNPVVGREAERREHEHALAVQALRELEFDRAMGKLEDDDYRALRRRLEIRALAGMEEWPKPHPAEAPAAQVFGGRQTIAALRPVTVNFCSQCGTKIDEAHNFCPNCGTARAATLAREMG